MSKDFSEVEPFWHIFGSVGYTHAGVLVAKSLYKDVGPLPGRFGLCHGFKDSQNKWLDGL